MSSKNPYDISMLCGRFQLFHKGHQSLVDTALKMSDRILILVGSAQESATERNPFDIQTRIEMIREVYPDSNVIIKPLTDLTHENDITTEWGKYLLKCTRQFIYKIPELMIYGNDESRSGWFSQDDIMDLTEIIVPRSRLPISGTMLREAMIMDDKETWFKYHSPKLHKYYDQLRGQLLEVDFYKKQFASMMNKNPEIAVEVGESIIKLTQTDDAIIYGYSKNDTASTSNKEEVVDDSYHKLITDLKNRSRSCQLGGDLNRKSLTTDNDIATTIIKPLDLSLVPRMEKDNWGCGCMIINDDNEMLMGLRCKATDKKEWSFPGGGVEVGETPLQAIRREIKEETNLEVKHVKYEGVIHKDGCLDFIFSCKDIKSIYELKPQKGEFAKLDWFDTNIIKGMDIFPFTMEALEMLKNKGAI